MHSDDIKDTRSVALIGHGGCGKTSLGEGIAFLTGLTTRLGRVDEGGSLLDHEPEEQKRGGSIGMAVLTCSWESCRVHVVDTPGEGNFLHEARAALQAVDAAVIVISAVDGVEVSTEQVAAFAATRDIPRVVFVNKMDRDNADYRSAVAALRDTLGLSPVLLQLPIGEEGAFRGVVDLVEGEALLYDGESGTPQVGEVPEAMRVQVDEAVEQLTEAVAVADDALLERYLDEGRLTRDELRRGLDEGVAQGLLCPVLLGSAERNIGVDRLLALTRTLPAPDLRRFRAGHRPGNPDEPVEVQAGRDAPFAAVVVKTLIDPYAGQVSILRVLGGTARTGDQLFNPRTEKPERLGNLFHLVGKQHVAVDEVGPGDLFAVAKLRDTATGDTLCDPQAPVVVGWDQPPPPMIAYTLTPRSRADVDKLKGGLARLLAEDPALRQSFDPVTKELVLSGMGAAHVQLAVERLERRFGVGVDLGRPSIPYRETITSTADVRYRHKKQTGGAGQFGEVAIRVRPAERGAGLRFVNAISGGVIPTALIPSVEKGVTEKLEQGILAGFPCVDVEVELYDGKYHPVDSKDIAFQIAGRQAIKEAVMQAGPVLLEPMYAVDVVAPADQVGDVMGDLNGRRGRVLDLESRGRTTVVRALAPLAEMLDYAPQLRSLTGGKGSYTMALHGYEQVPPHVQERVVAELARQEEEEV